MGNVHPLARAEFDQGVVAGDTRLEHMILQLEPAAAQQTELDALVEAQHNAESPLFHHWLTPAEYGARFGVSAQDLEREFAHGSKDMDSRWMRSRPVTGLSCSPERRARVAETFHTEIHRYRVDGVEHIANSQDPQIPAALAGVVGGVVSLHDFRRRSAD